MKLGNKQYSPLRYVTHFKHNVLRILKLIYSLVIRKPFGNNVSTGPDIKRIKMNNYMVIFNHMLCVSFLQTEHHVDEIIETIVALK